MLIATAAAVLTWLGAEWLLKGKPSLPGAASGAVADLVAFICYKIVDLTIGLRVKEEDEREGLDTTAHGERAYNL
jgi:ammonia channel protein AmtB